MKKYFIVMVLILIFCGCDPNYKAEEQPIYESHRVERHIDKEAGVVCWVYVAPLRGGISCMPIENTKLKQDN